MDVLNSLDQSLFEFCNKSLQNFFFDALMPFITDLNRKPLTFVLVALLWLLLLVRGGKSGRIAALLLIPAIVFADQLNSSILKHLIDRPRPCHALSEVRLLVSCGSGYSFPSSHAVNNFAGALVLAYFVPRLTWVFFTFAALVAFSRMYVGVHYPSDVVAGAVIGLICGAIVISLFRAGEMLWLRRVRSKELAK